MSSKNGKAAEAVQDGPLTQTVAQMEASNVAAEATREAAAEANAKADDAVAKERAKLAKQLEAVEKQSQQLAEKQRELADRQAELAQMLDMPKSKPTTLRIASRALNPRKALERLADIWADGPREAPTRVVAKTYRVTPVGSAAATLPIAEVSNCSDEGDAKAAYAMATGRQVAVNVEEIGREEYARESTADPAVAVA